MRYGSLGLSNSEMAVWRRCPRRWYLSHHLRLKKKAGDEPGSALSIGNSYHDALAAYYDPKNPVNPVEYVEAAYSLAITEHPSEEKELLKEKELLLAMTKGYLEWLAETGEDSNLIVQGSEQTVRVPLRSADGEPITLANGETLHLLSKLDAPVERKSDGLKLALEHKTTGSLDEPLGGYRIDAQFLTEHLARFLQAIEDGWTPEDAYASCSGILVNLAKKVKRTAAAKPPFYKRVDVIHNIHELRNHWKHVVQIAYEIADAEMRLNAGESHQSVCRPTPIPDRCKWECEFFRICPLADDGSDFEGALEAMFEERDPLERYAGTEEM
jgi:hypothetical protein